MKQAEDKHLTLKHTNTLLLKSNWHKPTANGLSGPGVVSGIPKLHFSVALQQTGSIYPLRAHHVLLTLWVPSGAEPQLGSPPSASKPP